VDSNWLPIREGGTFASKSVAVSNTAKCGRLSENLAAVIRSTGSGFAASGTALVAAGSQNNTSLLVNYTGNTATAGVVSGTATVSVYVQRPDRNGASRCGAREDERFDCNEREDLPFGSGIARRDIGFRPGAFGRLFTGGKFAGSRMWPMTMDTRTCSRVVSQ